jgi:four helix bundle protein
MKLVEEVYTATKLFPKEELYVLVSQMRRAALSVCSNIAEGASRISRPEKKRFYEISRSSLVELEQHLESIFRMLSKMIDNIKINPSLATS